MSQLSFADNKRYVEIFKKLVEIYIETGEAVGSRSLSKALSNSLSPATIRNVMSDLEDLGILCSKHTSSGRQPTEMGWRFFVNSLVEVGNLSETEVSALAEITKSAGGKNVETILESASEILSGLSNCVSLIMTPTINSIIKHIDFVLLSPGRAVVIIVDEGGTVENRLIEVPVDVSSSVLDQATKYINTKLTGLTLDEIRNKIQDELDCQEEGVDKCAKDLLENGLGFVINEHENKVIVHGQSTLFAKAEEIADLRDLLKKLDEKKTLKVILDKSVTAQGMQIFIGAETKMFEMAGCSIVVSPYQNTKKKLVGAIGVLGPSRMSYSRVIPLVDYTAKLLGNVV
ncbi:MAG: heat-inducible transcriptional repressor HrcA [Holosporales bacterium]|jgi:heat-inducible transcriptional repressor|nr:heat-inducible transcriptional repressor HrcA [Holosporales bacterium]